MSFPADLKYSKSHEWVRFEEDGTITIGITDHAQAALGDIVFLELPPVDSELSVGNPCAVIESVKAASDIYAPLSGTVIEINNEAVDAPESINANAFETWLFRMQLNDKDDSELMSASEYQALVDN